MRYFIRKFVSSFIALTLTTAVAASTQSADLPHYQSDYSRVKSYVFPLVPGDTRFSVVLIGLDRSDVLKTALAKSFFSSTQKDFGINDVSFEDFDPMFMLFLSERGVHDVYTFNMGNFNRNPMGVMPKLKGTSIEENIVHPERFPGLPFHLVDIQHARKSRFHHLAIKWFLEILTLAPLTGVVIAPVRALNTENENQIHVNIKELTTFISKDFENPDSVLKNYLSREQFSQMLAGFDVRFGSQDNLKSLFFGKAEKELVNYQKSQRVKASLSIKKMEMVAEQAEKEGLVLLPFGPNSGVLAVDISKPSLPDEVYQMISRADVNKAIEKYRTGKGGSLIGISAFVASEQTWTGDWGKDERLLYREMIDLQQARSQMKGQVFMNTFKMIRQVGYTIWPALISYAFIYGEVGLSLTAQAVESSTGHVGGKFTRDAARVLNKLFSFNLLDLSEVITAAELGFLIPAAGDEGKFFSAILGYMKDELSKTEMDNLRAEFASDDPEVVARASKALMIRYLGDVESSQYVFSLSHETQLETKGIYVHRLAHWLAEKPWRYKCGGYASCRDSKADSIAKQIRKDLKRETKQQPALALP